MLRLEIKSDIFYITPFLALITVFFTYNKKIEKKIEKVSHYEIKTLKNKTCGFCCLRLVSSGFCKPSPLQNNKGIETKPQTQMFSSLYLCNLMV